MDNFFNSESLWSLGGETDKGVKPEKNEDSFGIVEEKSLIIVCDGMGGHRGGSIASRTAVESVKEYFSRSSTAGPGDEPRAIVGEMVRALRVANQNVMAAAAADERLTGMGSTMVMAMVEGDRLHTCHVGDSRCYVITADSIKQLTGDHSLVAHLLANSQITEEEARNHPRRNVITKCIGVDSGDSPEAHSISIPPGGRVLLCSDGLWTMVSDERIREIVIGAASPEEAAEALIEEANAAGGLDNITAALAIPGKQAG